MIVVFEGHDGAGKTTLANMLAEQLGTKPFIDPNRMYFRKLGGIANSMALLFMSNFISSSGVGKKDNIVFDRWQLSEMVYADLFKRQTSQRANSESDVLMARAGAKILLCQKNTIDEIYKIKDEIVTPKQNVLSASLFVKYAKKSLCTVHKINTSKSVEESYADVLKVIGLE